LDLGPDGGRSARTQVRVRGGAVRSWVRSDPDRPDPDPWPNCVIFSLGFDLLFVFGLRAEYTLNIMVGVWQARRLSTETCSTKLAHHIQCTIYSLLVSWSHPGSRSKGEDPIPGGRGPETSPDDRVCRLLRLCTETTRHKTSSSAQAHTCREVGTTSSATRWRLKPPAKQRTPDYNVKWRES
jgi:hypothetical protein